MFQSTWTIFREPTFFFFLFVWDSYNPCFTTRYSTGYLEEGLRLESKCLLLRCCSPLWFCRCCEAWFRFTYSSSEWRMLLRKFETLTVCMWCFRIRCGGRLCSTAGRLCENRLQSIIRCLAVCTALSGQLHVGEDVFFILWRYDRNWTTYFSHVSCHSTQFILLVDSYILLVKLMSN
jgi:hypothetical protein